MRRIIWVVVLVGLTLGWAGCSACGRKVDTKKPLTMAGGYSSIEDLGRVYLETIEKKDPELLNQLLLTADDLAALQKGAGRQYWTAYAMIAKKAFLEKNKPFLGQHLELVRVQPGPVIGAKENVKMYRGTTVVFTAPDGKEYNSEINFILEANGLFKVFGLRYLSDELKRRGVLKDLGAFDGEAKFKGVDKTQDVNIKVKKTPKKNGEPPADKP
jgi:hypothetical protein